MPPTNSTEWQEHVNQLATTHHSRLGHTYQRVPDRTHGDGGLEGFSSCGCGYQAYFPDTPRDGRDLLQKQKNKIREDLDKLVDNAPFWERVLAGRALKEWNLVVPEHADKELLAYLRERVDALRAKGLPFLDPAFDGFVKTPDDFALARADLEGAGILAPDSIPIVRATEEDADQFSSKDPAFILQMDRKLLLAYSGDQAKAARSKKALLKNYLEACNFTDRLQRSQPLIYQRICEHQMNHETMLAIEDFGETRPGGRVILETLRRYQASLEQILPKLPTDRAQVIAAGTTARWLGECPLRLDDEA